MSARPLTSWSLGCVAILVINKNTFKSHRSCCSFIHQHHVMIDVKFGDIFLLLRYLRLNFTIFQGGFLKTFFKPFDSNLVPWARWFDLHYTIKGQIYPTRVLLVLLVWWSSVAWSGVGGKWWRWLTLQPCGFSMLPAESKLVDGAWSSYSAVGSVKRKQMYTTFLYQLLVKCRLTPFLTFSVPSILFLDFSLKLVVLLNWTPSPLNYLGALCLHV